MKAVSFDSSYGVTEDGRVWSFPKYHYPAGHWLKTTPDKMGYPAVNIGGKQYRVHQLVAKAFLPEPTFPDPVVNHKNSVRHDNRLENLEWLTRADNIRHGADKGHYCKKVRCKEHARLL